MSIFPSLPLFTDAYIADTTHLTMEEHGAYLRLLMFAWRSKGCKLPSDDKFLARMLGISLAKWLKLKPAVMAYWTMSGGHWIQKRLSKEHAFVTEKMKKRRAAGAQGGRPKSLPDNDQGKAKGSENGKQNKTKPKAPTPTPTPKDSPKAPKGGEHESFGAWWAEYPKRDGENPRAPAVAKYAWALREGATPETLMAAVRAYRSTLERHNRLGTQFVKQARYWLSDRPWADLPASTTQATNTGDAYLAKITDDRWRTEIRIWNRGLGDWILKSHTRPPDHPDTKVPKHILAEFGLGPTEHRELQPAGAMH